MMPKHTKSRKFAFKIPVWLLILLVIIGGSALIINQVQQSPAVKNTKTATNAKKHMGEIFPQLSLKNFIKINPK